MNLTIVKININPHDRMNSIHKNGKTLSKFPSKRALQEVSEKLALANKRHIAPYSHSMMAIINAEARRQNYIASLKAEYDLIANGLAEIVEHETYLKLQLTKNGITHQLMQDVLQTTHTEQQTACLVSFDIPEDVRFIRDWLREFLKMAGFTKQQRSVWFSKIDISLKLTVLLKHLKLDEWVKVHVTTQEKSETEMSVHIQTQSPSYS